MAKMLTLRTILGCCLAGRGFGFGNPKTFSRASSTTQQELLLSGKQGTRIIADKSSSSNNGQVWWLPWVFSAAVFLNDPMAQNHLHPPNALAAVEQGVTPRSVAAPAAPGTLPDTTLFLASNTFISATSTTTKSVLTTVTPRSGPIMDLARVLSDSERTAIRRAMQQAEKSTGTELQIILVDQISSGDMTPKELATTLFNRWRLGPADKNNGVLILAVLDQRRVEIEVGQGIGQTGMNAEWCSQTLQQEAVPAFRQGEYGQGILNTVKRVAQKLQEIDEATPAPSLVGSTTTAEAAPASLQRPQTNSPTWTNVMGGIVAFAAVPILTFWAIGSKQFNEIGDQEELTREVWKEQRVKQEEEAEENKQRRAAEALKERLRRERMKKQAKKNQQSQWSASKYQRSSKSYTSNNTQSNYCKNGPTRRYGESDNRSSRRYDGSDYDSTSSGGWSWGGSTSGSTSCGSIGSSDSSSSGGWSSGSSSSEGSSSDSGGFSDGDGGGADW